MNFSEQYKGFLYLVSYSGDPIETLIAKIKKKKQILKSEIQKTDNKIVVALGSHKIIY